MIWQYLNTGFQTGKFNMEFDINLARTCKPDTAILRFYRWKPFCISLGANQDFNSVNLEKVKNDNIDVVKRPTGGRAILHADELTYSVILPVSSQISAREIYREINLAILLGLKNYNEKLSEVKLENVQPDFKNFYKEEKSAICFAVSAKSEIKFWGKKLVGSAQRKLGNTILQHGSILAGDYHLKIVDYLNLNENDIDHIKNGMIENTTDLHSILKEEINYTRLENSLLTGFEEHFNEKFETVSGIEKDLISI